MDTSNLNFVAGQNIPNAVIVRDSDTGAVGVFNGSAGGVHVLVDVTGYIAGGTATADGMFVPVTQPRIADSRIQFQLGRSAARVGHRRAADQRTWLRAGHRRRRRRAECGSSGT